MILQWGFGPRAIFGASPTPGLSLTGLGRQVLARSGPGELDRMTPADCGHKLAQAIPGARTVDLPGVGHMLPLEAPDAVLNALCAIM